jgi:hypothetical protein
MDDRAYMTANGRANDDDQGFKMPDTQPRLEIAVGSGSEDPRHHS